MITGRTVLISEKLLKPLKLSKNSIKTNKDPLEYIRIDKKKEDERKKIDWEILKILFNDCDMFKEQVGQYRDGSNRVET